MTAHERFIDQEARDLANQAIALIETHERVCVANAEAAKDWRATTGDTLKRLEGLMWTAALGTLGLAVSIIMALLFKHP